MASSEKQKEVDRTQGADRKKASSPRKRSGGGVGEALRTAYEETVNETIPPEMLDLLGKLA